MKFVCEKCGYSSDKKVSFTKHLNRKTPCKKKTIPNESNNTERYDEPRERYDEPRERYDESIVQVNTQENNDEESVDNPTKILKISEDMLVDMMMLYYHSYKMMELKYGQEFVDKEKPNLRRLVDELLKIED